MDDGMRDAFRTRTLLGYALIENVDSTSIQAMISKMLATEVECAHCAANLKVTRYNALKITITESFRCNACGTINALPFSYI
jgi:hypothetical protein